MTSHDKSVLLSRRYMLKTVEADEMVKTTLDNYMGHGCDICCEAYQYEIRECGCTEVEINLYLDYLEREEIE